MGGGATQKALHRDGKTIGERVGSVLAYRIRVEILTLLNQAVYATDELAEIVGESRQVVNYHLKTLEKDGSIEVVKTEERRGGDLHYYRAVKMAEYSEEDIEAMTPEERQAVVGYTVQGATAEILAALSAGKLTNDKKVVLAWRWFNFDQQGCDAFSEGQVRWWRRIQEIEAESANRRAQGGEETTSYVVVECGFERVRTAPVPTSRSTGDPPANFF